MPERCWIYIATLATFLATLYAARKAYIRQAPIHSATLRILLFIALIAQTTFLHLRGLSHGHCPTTNPFETLAFLNWASLLTYQLIGTPFRHSSIGLMTAPLATFINILALLMPLDYPTQYRIQGWMMELHIATTLLAYGILGLASMAALFYIIQQRILKRRLISHWLYTLPSIDSLITAQFRLHLIGTLCLFIGFSAGIMHLIHNATPPTIQFTTHIILVLAFIFLLLSNYFQWLPRKVIAATLIITYCITLATINWLQGFSTGL